MSQDVGIDIFGGKIGHGHVLEQVDKGATVLEANDAQTHSNNQTYFTQDSHKLHTKLTQTSHKLHANFPFPDKC